MTIAAHQRKELPAPASPAACDRAVTGAASPHLRTGHANDAAETLSPDGDGLGGVDLSVSPGDFVAVMRRRPAAAPGFERIAPAGSRRVAFVFRSYNPLPHATVLENVASPMAYAGVSESRRTRIALQAMDFAGVLHLADCEPHVLTPEQRQRAAIARCLVNDPNVILADEPVARLDACAAGSVMRLLCRLNTERGITIVLVTQEPGIAAYARRVVTFEDGRAIAARATDQDATVPIPYTAPMIHRANGGTR